MSVVLKAITSKKEDIMVGFITTGQAAMDLPAYAGFDALLPHLAISFDLRNGADYANAIEVLQGLQARRRKAYATAKAKEMQSAIKGKSKKKKKGKS